MFSYLLKAQCYVNEYVCVRLNDPRSRIDSRNKYHEYKVNVVSKTYMMETDIIHVTVFLSSDDPSHSYRVFCFIAGNSITSPMNKIKPLF